MIRANCRSARSSSFQPRPSRRKAANNFLNVHRKSAYFLFLAVLVVLVIGIVMLFSTSAFAKDSKGDVYFFVKRQGVWVGIGLMACVAASLIDYHFWQKTWWIWFGLALFALTLCFVPHIRIYKNGSY